MYGAFLIDIAAGRRKLVAAVRDGFAQGRLLAADDARREGLVDRIEPADAVFSELVDEIRRGATRASRWTDEQRRAAVRAHAWQRQLRDLQTPPPPRRTRH